MHPAAAAAGAERASRVRALFAGIAHRYDLVNRLASLGLDVAWRRRAVAALGLAPGDWCLDVCCGTGDLSVAVGERGARVLGVDFCRPMLEQAEGKPGVAHRVSFAEGDALALPVASGAFDAACVGFGIRNVADTMAGLRELRRVLRPGGRLAVLEFSRPRPAPVAWVASAWSDVVVPRLGDWLTGANDYRYLPETIETWHEPEALAALMRDAGFASVTWRRMSLGVVALHVGQVEDSGGLTGDAAARDPGTKAEGLREATC